MTEPGGTACSTAVAPAAGTPSRAGVAVAARLADPGLVRLTAPGPPPPGGG